MKFNDVVTCEDYDVIYSFHEMGVGNHSIEDVSKAVYQTLKEDGLTEDDDSFYTWSYDLRWCLKRLRDAGFIKRESQGRRGMWSLNKGEMIHLCNYDRNFDCYQQFCEEFGYTHLKELDDVDDGYYSYILK